MHCFFKQHRRLVTWLPSKNYAYYTGQLEQTLPAQTHQNVTQTKDAATKRKVEMSSILPPPCPCRRKNAN